MSTDAEQAKQEKTDRQIFIQAKMAERLTAAEIVAETVKEYGVSASTARRDLKAAEKELCKAKENKELWLQEDILTTKLILQKALAGGDLANATQAQRHLSKLQDTVPSANAQHINRGLQELARLAMASGAGAAGGAKGTAEAFLASARADQLRPRTVTAHDRGEGSPPLGPRALPEAPASVDPETLEATRELDPNALVETAPPSGRRAGARRVHAPDRARAPE